MFRSCRKAERDNSIAYISKILLDSGCREDEIENAKAKALQLDCTKILSLITAPSTEEREKNYFLRSNMIDT